MKYLLFICLSLYASESSTKPFLNPELKIEIILNSLVDAKARLNEELTKEERAILEEMKHNYEVRKEADEAFSVLDNLPKKIVSIIP
jgi:hypothetical protein